MTWEKFDLYLAESENLVSAFIIGDGFLSKFGSLMIEQGHKQKDYLFWKYYLLKEVNFLSGESFPAFISRFHKATNKVNYSYRFATRNLFKSRRDEFYQYSEVESKIKKRFPFPLKDSISPLMLAIWFMDDGSIGGNTRLGLVIDISNFSLECRALIRDMFWERFGIKTSFHNGKSSKGNSTCKLYFKRKTIEKFYLLINPYILESMRYKLRNLEEFFNNPVTT